MIEAFQPLVDVPKYQDIQDTELFEQAPDDVKIALVRDPRFLDRMMLHLASEHGDSWIGSHPLARGTDFGLVADFYEYANDDTKAYIDKLFVDFSARRKEQLEPYRQAYETHDTWDGDLNFPPEGVRRSGFQRYPQFVHNRVRGLKGDLLPSETIAPGVQTEMHSAKDDFDARLKRESRYGEVFDRYYQGNEGFRQYANKVAREYPEMQRQKRAAQMQEAAERQEREREALQAAKQEIKGRLASLRAAGHSASAIEHMLRDILAERG